MIDPKTVNRVRHFKWADVKPDGRQLSALRSEVVYDPPIWMRAGRQQTASGYGAKLNSGYMVNFEGRYRRVYVTIFSNVGTSWFMVNKQKVVISIHGE